MRAADERTFIEFVTGAHRGLRRTAYLMTGDWHRAEDAVQTALVKVYVAWPRLDRANAVREYARRAVVTTVLDQGRRPWRREQVVATVTDSAAADDETQSIDDRLTLVQALAHVPARQRATLVLRYLDDLSVEETAVVLGCSTGTVKSQTARGLTSLRRFLAVPADEPITIGKDA